MFEPGLADSIDSTIGISILLGVDFTPNGDLEERLGAFKAYADGCLDDLRELAALVDEYSAHLQERGHA